ncbi:Alpha/Beta hydrolase fold [Sesbania bispinosa]|nr:Alpha/Beta hydrolase fold [Sesbania bispinosa]
MDKEKSGAIHCFTFTTEVHKDLEREMVNLVTAYWSLLRWVMKMAVSSWGINKKYAVYVPDLLFFGGSGTDKQERSPAFIAECLAVGLRKLGVEKCIMVGFSYGGFVAFKMAEMYPEVVQAIVISGSIVAMMDSINTTTVQAFGFCSCSEMLLPTSVKGLKTLLSIGAHKNLLLPNRLCKDFLKVMYSNRKERGELLEALVISDKNINIPNFPQEVRK